MSILNTNRHLAVVGDPIEHSKSPLLHEAAYRVLGLEWDYSRRLVPESHLASFVEGLADTWRGLSVTMPLKTEAFEVASIHDEASRLTGVANTLLLSASSDSNSGRTIRAFNTDVAGLVNPLRQLGIEAGSGLGRGSAGAVIGSGATALSAVVALRDLGFSRVTVVARSESNAQAALELSTELGMEAAFAPLTKLDDVDSTPVTISTVPGRANVDLSTRQLKPGDILFDIAYDTWPSVNAGSWADRGGRTLSGLSMLSAQALEQVRIFVTGEANGILEHEAQIQEAMNAAVGLDESGLFVRSVG